MPENKVIPAATDAPQFARAEYSVPGTDSCKICGAAIAGSYFRVNNAMACASCAQQAKDGQPVDSHVAYSRGLLLGVGAAVIGMILYAGFTIVTEIELGYIALAVGWLVGKGMLTGSGGIGGRRYQITAVLLTYAAVSVAAIPIAIGISIKNHRPLVRQQQQQSTQAEGATANEAEAAAPVRPRWERLAIALVMLLGYGLASPILELQSPVHGVIGLVILLVGLRIAWQMTAPRNLNVDGPFDAAPATP